ncbi:MAG: M3 family oligoendopeptidase [Rickettsiales bacterium]|nr:M3 family oligoendopeptidase [Rickettsiales bacterium]
MAVSKKKPIKSKKIELKELPRWDLTHFYPSAESAELAKDLGSFEKRCKIFEKTYDGEVKLLNSGELVTAIKKYEKIEDLAGKLGSFAQLYYCENVSDPKRAKFYQDISEALTENGSSILFFTLQINKITDKSLQTMLADSAALAKYEPWLRDVRQMRPYQLPEAQEKMLHEKSVVGRASWARLYDETMAGLRFKLGAQTLTSEEMLDKMSSSNPKTRATAAKVYGEGLAENASLFTLITNTLAKDKAIEDGFRNFERPISSRNLANAVEDEVVDALMSSVKASYPKLSHRYYKLKASWFKKKKLDYWDRNAPMPSSKEQLYSYADAKKIVLKSYKDFSPEMAKIGERFFKENWIDAPASPGKAGGAFSHPTVPSVHPYILLNYLAKPRDVMTLAHELGHGVHQVLSAKQGALMADTPLTLAETASVFGEQLTFRAMLKAEKDTKKRKALIAHKVEDMLNTVVRQIAFFEFERQVHDARAEGELSTEELGKIWMGVQKESLGPAIKFSKEYENYWTYIPHFIHTPFYVYAYAFGDCLVNSLYAVYQQYQADGKAKEFEKLYIEMLSAGGTLRHKELLAPFGLDASKPEFWQQGLDIISSMIDELEE